MFRGVARHLIPEGGCFDLLNYLLDDEDGLPYKRGGGAYLSTAAAGNNFQGGAVALWDGRLVGGYRTVVATTNLARDTSTLYVAAADDASLAEVGGALAGSGQVKFTEYNGILVIGVGAGDSLTTKPYVYAGSRKTAQYSTGTVAMTAGSRTVVGSGTSWTTNADAGMIFIHDEGGSNRWNVVESIDSATTLTLRWPWTGNTDASSAYSLNPASDNAMSGSTIAACPEWVAGRICGVKASQPNQMAFTGFTDEGYPHFGTDSNDYHAFQGAILGIHAIRDMALVFTTSGLYAVRNMSFDLTDPTGNVQQTVERIDGMVLWSQQGVVPWGNALVVPARDGVYLVDGVSTPVLLSRSVSDLYREYVASGYRPGQGTIFRNTYVLPFVDSSLVVQGWLTCKLDAGDAETGFWPWTRLSAGVPRPVTVRNRPDSQPKLLGAAAASGGRMVDLKWFDPSATYKNDADGSAFTFTWETRDYPTGSGNRNTVKRARVAYDLVDAGSDNPAFTFSYASEDGSYTALSDTAGEASPGNESWPFVKRGRYVRFKLSCATAAASASVKSVEAWVRQSAKD